jgi:hypothetical protein
MVKSIRELDMSGPQRPVAMTVKAVKVPSNDPWTGTRENDPSNWKLEYRIKGFDNPFYYRIRYPDPPNQAPIDSVTVHPAAWRYNSSRQENVWGIYFVVRQGTNGPFTGFIELDDYGYPVKGRFTYQWSVFDKELEQQLTPWRRWGLWVKNHEIDSVQEAIESRPRNTGYKEEEEMGAVFRELLGIDDSDIRHQTLEVMRYCRVVDAETIPLVKRCLSSKNDAVVTSARCVMEVYRVEERIKNR